MLKFDPYDPTFFDDPYPTYARMRSEAPVYRHRDPDYFMLSRHQDITAAMSNPRTFSSARGVLIDTDSSSICDDRAAELATLKKRIIEECRERAPDGVKLVETLRAALPRETIVVSDLTVAAYWCRRLLDYYEPRTNVYPWGFCTLGFGVPAAIGAVVVAVPLAARADAPSSPVRRDFESSRYQSQRSIQTNL